MRVYAESNFVLEIVLEQEQHGACEKLVELAENKTIELALPAFALLEPYQTLVRREQDRVKLSKTLDDEIRQLKRTASMLSQMEPFDKATALLLQASQKADTRFSDVRARLLATSRLLVIDGPSIAKASEFIRDFGLELPDALMLASVLEDATARRSPSVFLNRNTRDFDDQDIVAKLHDLDCSFIGSFQKGLQRVETALRRRSSLPS